MAISANDVSYSIIPEATLGTTPTSAASRFELPIKSGQAAPTYKANEIQSQTMRPNRASNGARRGNGSGEGSFEFGFQKDAAIKLLMASALSGTWTGTAGSQVLKAGKTDSSFSTIAKLASNLWQVSAGGVCSGFNLSAKAADGISASFDMVFTKRTNAASDASSSLSVTASAGSPEYIGSEVTNITVDGDSSLQYTELTLQVTQDRAMRNVLGSSTPIGVGTSGNRQVKLTIKAYRESFAVDTLIDGTPQPVSFQIGGAGDGYIVTLPAAIGAVPTDETGDDMMVVVEFTAAYDGNELTDLKIAEIPVI
jgi:hypothetical protein